MRVASIILLHLSNRKPHLVFEIFPSQADENKNDGAIRALLMDDHFRGRGETRAQLDISDSI